MKNKLNACKSLGEFEVLYPPRTLTHGAEVVRIAPSPTGMPHIGTAMQSVINKALAKKTGGLFILRIEDTDQARTIPGAVEAIADALRWLGTTPDEGVGYGGAYAPYLQSDRLNLYQVAAEHLVSQGHAYRCFCTEDRLAKLRTAQSLAKQMPRYDSHCATLPPDEVQKKIHAGEKSVIRMRIPKMDSKIQFTDLVRGVIEFDAKMIDDSVILKSDGFPTYHLASVVDDHFMRITTIVRGEEWISSTPKHITLYRAFGWQAPRFLHTVLLRDEDRHKLSKRSGDTSIKWFQGQGYSPAGLVNFLTRILWAHPDNKDIYSFDEFASLVSPAALPSTGPVVDLKLLGFVNSHYIAKQSARELRQNLDAYLGYILDTNTLPFESAITMEHIKSLRAEIAARADYAEKVLGLEPGRYQKYSDIILDCAYFFDATTIPAQRELLLAQSPAPEGIKILNEVLVNYNIADNHDTWSEKMKKIASDMGLKNKAVFMLTRIAISGCEHTPPLFEIMQILGAGEVTKRIQGAIKVMG